MAIGSAVAQNPAPSGGGAEAADHEHLVALGQRIYREGIGVSGEPLKAMGAARAVLEGGVVACAACHRRSGFGTSEGQFTIRPVTAKALFEQQTQVVRSPRIKAQLGTRQRAPYTEELLGRAIRAGVDSDGQPLDPVMPRYMFSDQDVRAITAYLSTLSAQSSPGVDDEDIHFATVIQPDVDPKKRRAMLDIMEAFLSDKNSNARSEDRRRDAGTMRMYRSYRKWHLHVWELKGASGTWRQQLEAFYMAQPVFAMVGGLGTTSWEPIHDFAEQFEIPSLFPQVEWPVVEGVNNHNLYFSKGTLLDAEVLAKFLRDPTGKKPAKVVQVFQSSTAGRHAAETFAQALGKGITVEDVDLDNVTANPFLSKGTSGRPDAWVLWLDAPRLKSLMASGALPSEPIYLSQAMLGENLSPETFQMGTDVRLIYPSDLPPKHASRLLRTKIWMHNKRIPVTDEAVQVNTQFAMTMLSDALGHTMDSFSRDYLIEFVEHIVPLTPSPSLYPNVGLAPGQRFAAKGRSVVQLTGDPQMPLKALSGWIVP